MGAIQRGTSWATIPKTLNRVRTVHAPCAHRATTPPMTTSLTPFNVLIPKMPITFFWFLVPHVGPMQTFSPCNGPMYEPLFQDPPPPHGSVQQVKTMN